MLADTTIGAIPFFGDAFDVIFKANTKNMALLRRDMRKRGLTPPGPVIEGGSRTRPLDRTNLYLWRSASNTTGEPP